MAKLIIEIEVQSYNGEEEEMDALLLIGTTIEKIISLAELGIGTFCGTRIEASEATPVHPRGSHDLVIAIEVRKRDRVDTGKRLTLDELIRGQGFDPSDFGLV